MRCPKCGKVLQKTNDGSYVCAPDCKYVFDSCKIVKNQKKMKNRLFS